MAGPEYEVVEMLMELAERMDASHDVREWLAMMRDRVARVEEGYEGRSPYVGRATLH